MSFVEQGHLGGYIPGGDEATYYPELWTWLVEGPEKVECVLDVGCGDGAALDYFIDDLGIRGMGLEGVFQNHLGIQQHDFEKGIYEWGVPVPPEFDLVWSCEFVEHVEEDFVPNFLDSFAKGKIVLMTHAVPGQDGYHHVNLQQARYWIEKMRSIDYTLDVDLTFKTRTLAGSNQSPWNHYVRSGLAFRRNHD